MCVTLLSALLCAVRGQESTVVYYHGDYEFENIYTKKKYRIKERNKSVTWNVSKDGEENGFVRTSDGYGEYFTGWMIFTMIFAPVLGITQIIGLIFAFISSPNNCFFSSYTKLEYSDFSCSFLQRILHFFFNFVFW